jgi:glycosyltransferase involved in cell wall biosynthesis
MKPPIAVVVATKDRPQHVPELLNCLRLQSEAPALIVVVDASVSDAARIATRGACDTNPAIVYVESDVASSASQRNIGMDFALARLGTDAFVAFLDDDTRPGAHYLSTLRDRLVNSGEECAGVSGTTGYVRSSSSSIKGLYRRVFLLDSRREEFCYPVALELPSTQDTRASTIRLG